MIKITDDFDFKIGDKIVVGCSTGPDSMALVDMLLKVRSKYKLDLIIAHVNHNVRAESKKEEEFLRDYCEKNNLIFETMKIEEYGDDNFHNEARNIRYVFFDSVVKKYAANYLMTAHHGDDLIETILMRLVRGSNLNGYSGFKKIVEMDGYYLVRPLLNYTKKELEEYDAENDVKFFVDSSNEKDKYTRNRYRKYVLPFLKAEDKNVHLKFIKYSKTIAEASKFINKVRDNALKRVLVENKIIIDKFLLEDEYLQREILYYMLENYYQDDLILVNDRHIDLILKLINNRKANSFVNLPNEVLAKKNYNYCEFVKEADFITSYEVEFDNYVSLPNGHSIEKVEKISDNSNNVCRLDSNEVLLPLIVRTRHVGDRIKVKGLGGSKKVKDIFIDRKMSVANRDVWPVVVDSKGEIVWIPGIKKSKFDKRKTDNYDIILRYI